MGRPKRTAEDQALIATMGRRLRWVREAYDMTQGQMARAVGLDQTTWSYYESGKRWPDQFAAVRLVARLKISVAYLLEGSLDGVERELAIRLAASHPELVPPRGKEPHTDRARA
jgi:transcriptional regulator with XRE-family HTH domain